MGGENKGKPKRHVVSEPPSEVPMALGATRASLRRRQTLPRESTDGWEEPESHDAVSFLTQTSLVTSHHQETSFLGEGTLLFFCSVPGSLGGGFYSAHVRKGGGDRGRPTPHEESARRRRRLRLPSAGSGCVFPPMSLFSCLRDFPAPPSSYQTQARYRSAGAGALCGSNREVVAAR